MMRALAVFMILVAAVGFYLFLGLSLEGQVSFKLLDRINIDEAFDRLGSHFPNDAALLAGSLFVFLTGTSLLFRRRTRDPRPRIPSLLLLNGYMILSLWVCLAAGSKQGTEAFLLGVMGVTLGLSLVMGFVMIFLASRIEHSLLTPAGLVGLLIHLAGAAGLIACAVVRVIQS